ncbi:MAG: hypothetical protein RDA78_15260 [Roseibium sp.]|uniref:hypothetical protein n=1 Tax=Roseibium sp. TaxID=1936156 RepID=UPI003D9C31E3
MAFVTSTDASKRVPATGFSPVVLFLLAIALLMLMSLAIAPSLLLPLSAFVTMAAVTHLLGMRLFEDLRQAIERDG